MTLMQEDSRLPEDELLPGSTYQSAWLLAIIAGGLGLAVEILFFGHRLGISFFIWALLSVGGLFLAARLHDMPFHLRSLPLVLIILFFAAMVAQRRDPFTVSLDILLTLALFGVLVQSFSMGNWLGYGVVEYFLSVVWTPLRACWLPWGVLRRIQERMAGDGEVRRKSMAVLRGVILAIPVLVVLISLLTSADLIFRDQLGRVLAWMNVEKVLEMFGRIALILLSGLFSLGALVAALRSGSLGSLRGHVDRLLRPFLGWIEAVIMLGLVDALFAAFMLIQLKYLFGGESQISAAGYTYAEYARRGFGELMTASVFSLGLIMALATWVKLETRAQAIWFKGLSTLLVFGIGVMLASSLVRLLAYEGAYGFTRLRTYSHAAILWIAALFLGFLILLLTGRLRHITLIVALVGIGYGGSLNFMKVDSFVVRENLDRYAESGKIDLAYLTGLSVDAVPGLVAISDDLVPSKRAELLPQLACRARVIDERRASAAWPEVHLSFVLADRALQGLQEDLAPYRVYQVGGSASEGAGAAGEWTVSWPGGEERCRGVYGD